MSLWTIKAHELIAAQARQLAQLARESDDHLTLRANPRATAGDELRMRGVPIQARGVSGTMRGTQPHTEIR
jgi:hypothetical protein